MPEFFHALRSACLPAIWSQAVKLARAGAVVPERASDSERTFRVRAPGQPVAPTVTLYCSELEWTCDCGGKVDPCAHIAAAGIVAEQDARRDPGELSGVPTSEGHAHLEYRLTTKDKVLCLTRFIVSLDRSEERINSLASEAVRARLPREIVPSQEDMAIDRVMANSRRETIPFDRLASVLRALSGSAHVTFEGESVQVSGETVLPRVILEDGDNDGYRLRLEQAARITAVVAFGVARLGDTLAALGETQLTGQLLERLPLCNSFRREEQADLVTRVLPELEARLPVEVMTRRLPSLKRDIHPRIQMDLSHHGHTLSVLPTLVYGDPPILRIDGGEGVSLGGAAPVRHRDEEQVLLHRLRDQLNLIPGRRVDLNGAEAIRFASRLRDFQRSMGDASHAAVFGSGRALVPRLILDGSTMDLVFEVESDPSETPGTRCATAATVLRAWRDGLDLVPLAGGGWAPLPSEWLAEHGHRALDLIAARTEDGKLPNAALPDLALLCEALNVPRPPRLEKLNLILGDFKGLPRAPLPADLKAELRSYQTFGVDWLSFLRSAGLGAVLADDMGLGKTLQTICVLSGRALVVCPKSVVHNWAAEIARFRPGLRTAIYQGTNREFEVDADVTLTTYAVLRLDADRIAERRWDIVVLDEAQAIKNPESQTARAAFQLQGDFRVALSGTPVENRLEELWSLVHFVNPGLLGGRADFQERYAQPISAGNAAATARLRTKVRPFVLRRMKREVLPELPARTDAVIHVELDPIERGVYDAVRAATQRDLLERLGQGGGVLVALEALLRLRQAACHSGLVPGQNVDRSSKVERLIESLSEAASEGHKSLVFSQWTGLLDRVEPHLKEAGIAFTRLDGSTRDRGAVVSSFQADDGPPVMLVSLKAGGTGLNLTAADHVFLLDPWWNPAVEDQAADRAHRIGQDRPVMVYRMVAKDTVEERILALQDKKRALADAALGEADHAEPITRAELLALLE